MADFYQTGLITTLSHLKDGQGPRLERVLDGLKEERPMALVLPCLSLELEYEGLGGVARELTKVNYLSRIVVSVSAPNRRTFLSVASKFEGVLTHSGEPPTFIWVDGPGISALCLELRRKGFNTGQLGKTLSVWLAHGWLLLKGSLEVVATHDCDIEGYDRELLARLLYPAADPKLDYDFVKGYYPRFGDCLYGRVTRLLVFPLLQAMRKVLPPSLLLEFIACFRYPLAGESSMKFDFISRSDISQGWGLEISTLAEVFENIEPEGVCQVDLGSNYNHRHRELSPENPDDGLHKMAIDVCKALLVALVDRTAKGALLGDIEEAYARFASGTIRRYRDLAVVNGLAFDVDREKEAVNTFSKALIRAGTELAGKCSSEPDRANWGQIMVKLPNFLGRFGETIEAEAPR